MKKLKILLMTIASLALITAQTFAATTIVWPNGNSGNISVASGSKITVFTQGNAKVYKKIGFYWDLETTVSGTTYLSSAVS